jgi:predicted HicB family RNase H-like nuclease
MLRIEPKVHAAAIKKAARSGVSLNKWAESILKEATSQA